MSAIRAESCSYHPADDPVTVSDGDGDGVDTVTVDPVNDPPAAVDDAATTGEDTAVTIE